MTYPAPEIGLVISYSFLWSGEAAQGRTEGSKIRPCAIILSLSPDPRVPDGQRVAVVPITHARPRGTDGAVELPAAVRRHLGLDDDPSWVVLDELNVFVWPGFDLRPIPGRPGQYAYGFLPPKFLDVLRAKLRERRTRGRLSAFDRE